MIRRLSYIVMILAVAVWMASCVRITDAYKSSLVALNLHLVYPEGYESAVHEGAEIALEDINTLSKYTALTNAQGVAQLRMPRGLYRATVSDGAFNGNNDKFVLEADSDVNVELLYSKPATLLIKEIYCGGCKKLPADGNYQSDQYVMLHNNDSETVYLDSLCFGTLAPYNSNSANPWGKIIDTAPVIQAVWQLGGSGKDHPLASGADAVICLRGAIDHTVQFPLSVNLNREGYYVLYNNTYFWNPTYHPVPGDKIAVKNYFDVVVKTGQANAYTFSINSPTVIIFKAVGTTIQEYVLQEGTVTSVPGSSIDRVTMIPWSWIIDGVEVFNGSSGGNKKRLRSDVDAGYVTQAESFKGLSVMRRVDEQASEASGYEILVDTNNSSKDFYEREEASLRNE